MIKTIATALLFAALFAGTARAQGRSATLDSVIAQVGNYGEMYQRNIAPLDLARGPNALTTAGGLQYAPLLR